MDASKIVSALGILFGLVVLVAAAVAVARASFAKAQIEALRGDRDDLLKRVELLESDNLRLGDAHRQAQEKVRVLEKVVTGREQLDHLQATMDQWVADTVEWRREQRSIALDIAAMVGGQRRQEQQRQEDEGK